MSPSVATLASLECAEVVRSRWLWLVTLVYAALATVFVGVGLRESSVLGFTGVGRVLFSLSHALVYVLPLLALLVTGPLVTRAREDGTLELLLTLPIGRGHYLAVVAAVRLAALVAPLALAFLALGLGARAFGGAVPWGFLGQALGVCAALLWCFAALGLALSCLVRTGAHALVALLLVWLAAVALLDFGVIGILLRWQLAPQAVLVLACLNPVEAARVALLAGSEPDLATLGPVGFYLADRLGSAGLVALGVGWPVALGSLAYALARARFARDDLV
jgi:ABC-type transport system involved in multi-copper enzyme maturation permease subunit